MLHGTASRREGQSSGGLEWMKKENGTISKAKISQ